MANKDSASGSDRGNSPKGSGLRRLKHFLERDIWEYGVGEDPSLKGQWVALLRILSVSWKGLFENRLFSRAAALSYSSLIALGPLVAVVVILSTSFIKTNPELQIKKALLFIAPSLQEMVTLDESAPDDSASEAMATALDTLITQIIEGGEALMDQVNTGGSKAFGLLGSLILIWVVIQLLTSVETTLNQIWGIHQGRPWSQRIVFYWTFISLGALLGLGSTALLSASNLAGLFQWMPFGEEMTGMIINLSPILSFLMLILLLVLFYRFFPNTAVAMKPALVGSLLTASLLFVNNYLSILYVHRVISIQSFYGSVGIIPVLMIGLYFFWILILLGGQLTYAVQNVSFLANQAAWKRISNQVRELVTLSAFLQIARKFQQCEPAPTMTEISNRLHIPVNILNESLERLESMGWITRIAPEGGKEKPEETGFRPGQPLDVYNLSRFKTAMDEYGHSDMSRHLIREDDLLKQFYEALEWHKDHPLCQSNLKDLLSN
jgi:membrane protein